MSEIQRDDDELRVARSVGSSSDESTGDGAPSIDGVRDVDAEVVPLQPERPDLERPDPLDLLDTRSGLAGPRAGDLGTRGPEPGAGLGPDLLGAGPGAGGGDRGLDDLLDGGSDPLAGLRLPGEGSGAPDLMQDDQLVGMYGSPSGGYVGASNNPIWVDTTFGAEPGTRIVHDQGTDENGNAVHTQTFYAPDGSVYRNTFTTNGDGTTTHEHEQVQGPTGGGGAKVTFRTDDGELVEAEQMANGSWVDGKGFVWSSDPREHFPDVDQPDQPETATAPASETGAEEGTGEETAGEGEPPDPEEEEARASEEDDDEDEDEDGVDSLTTGEEDGVVIAPEHLEKVLAEVSGTTNPSGDGYGDVTGATPIDEDPLGDPNPEDDHAGPTTDKLDGIFGNRDPVKPGILDDGPPVLGSGEPDLALASPQVAFSAGVTSAELDVEAAPVEAQPFDDGLAFDG